MNNTTETSIDISVVIPTLNEEHNIGDCISSLHEGTLQPFEVIVCDGYSTDRTKQVADAMGAIVIPNPAKSAAAGRNRGIAASSSSIVAFIDADCVADPNWLQQLADEFSDETIDGVAGKVEPRSPRNRYERFWNHLNWEVIMPFGDVRVEIKERSLKEAIITASSAYRKRALLDVGCFDEWFGNNAEDVDLCWRLLAKGAKLVYQPKAIVHASGVLSMKELRNKAFRDGMSSSKLQKRYGKHFNFDPNIYRLLAANITSSQRGNPDTTMERNELIWHLLGKYYGSFTTKVINI